MLIATFSATTTSARAFVAASSAASLAFRSSSFWIQNHHFKYRTRQFTSLAATTAALALQIHRTIHPQFPAIPRNSPQFCAAAVCTYLSNATCTVSPPPFEPSALFPGLFLAWSHVCVSRCRIFVLVCWCLAAADSASRAASSTFRPKGRRFIICNAKPIMFNARSVIFHATSIILNMQSSPSTVVSFCFASSWACSSAAREDHPAGKMSIKWVYNEYKMSINSYR